MHRNHVVNQVKNKYDEAGQQDISFLNFPQISKFFFCFHAELSICTNHKYYVIVPNVLHINMI